MKQKTEFAVQTDRNGVVNTVGKSYMMHPPIKYDGRKTKWFDDSLLLKKGCANHDRQRKG